MTKPIGVSPAALEMALQMQAHAVDMNELKKALDHLKAEDRARRVKAFTDEVLPIMLKYKLTLREDYDECVWEVKDFDEDEAYIRKSLGAS